ncbi:conjugative transfer relaxase/helicase TraI domain-containing protein, partial [Escherichia coli]|uniref:conjugative transfer relaxase/helicase TraI domain-containing protein n=1 Tax=Escherichia coli TaxID=562 RepID=UPI003D7F33B8
MDGCHQQCRTERNCPRCAGAETGPGGHERRASVQYGTGAAGRGGRPCRSPSGGAGRGDSPARFIAPGRKYPQPYVALPAFDRN